MYRCNHFSVQAHGNFQLFRVTPRGDYPSERKVGNLLPACDCFLCHFRQPFYGFALQKKSATWAAAVARAAVGRAAALNRPAHLDARGGEVHDGRG